MRRSVLMATAVLTGLTVALGLVTNYASEEVPAFFKEDIWRTLFALGMLAEAVVIVTLTLARLQSPSPAVPPPSRVARRRAIFADVLWDEVARPAMADWRDSRFTELEVEIEVEVQTSFYAWWLRRRGGSPRVERLPSLTHALRASKERVIILEGEPGSGKSVSLQHLSAQMMDEFRHRPTEYGVIPVYLNLKNFEASPNVSVHDVERFVRSSLNPNASRDIDHYLEDRFDADRADGRWIFLFDSFDEIPAVLSATEAGHVIEAYVKAIVGFVGLSRSRAVIASRAFRGPSRNGRPLFRVMPLTPERREKFVRNAGLDADIEQALLDGLDDMVVRVQQLTDNPLFLGLLCEYVQDTQLLPQSTHAVIEGYVQKRLSIDMNRIENLFVVDVTLTRRVAEEMAFVMLAEADLGLTARRSILNARVAERCQLAVEEVDSAIDALLYCHLARYADAETRTRITFYHRRLQEYFATCAVIRDKKALTPERLLTDGRWRETAVVILQTQDAEHSVGLLTAIERRLWSAATGNTTLWHPGTLYLLDLMANALAPEEIAQHSAGKVANKLLGRAWRDGSRLDKKWVIELCAAAGSERAVGYLKQAFVSDSMWLRDEAYRQVRRVGSSAARIEPEIRQMLVDLSVDGRLRRERRATRIQMQRLPFRSGLPRVVDLLLAAPVAASLAGPLGMILLIVFTPSELWLWPLVVLAVPFSSLASWVTLLNSSNRAVVRRLMQRKFGRWGISSGILESVARAAVLGMAATATVCLALLWYTSTPQEGVMAPLGVVVIIVSLWIWLWPIGAIMAASEGVWTERRYLIALPFAPLRRALSTIKGVRGRFRQLLSRSSLNVADALVGLAGTVLLISAVWGVGAFVINVLHLDIDLVILFAVVLTGGYRPAVALYSWGRWLVFRRRDRRVVSELISKSEIGVADMQRTLGALQTEEGIRRFLSEAWRHGLFRKPDDIDFLKFLFVALDSRHVDLPSISASATSAVLRDQRSDWRAWWLVCTAERDVLSNPSSELLDEAGRILELALRGEAFRQ